MLKSNDFIINLKQKYPVDLTFSLLKKTNNYSVLVIGDTIIDHYVFVKIKGRAIKDPILSVEYANREIYAGGILAIANHLSDFVDNVKLITLIGDHDSQLEFINQSLKSNIQLKTFTKMNSPTTTKKRMIDSYRGNKLFKIEYINDKPISNNLTNEINEYLDSVIDQYDLVIVGDFGHGFINDAIRRKLEEKAKFLAINTQSNSANMGYNYINLYNRIDFAVMNEEELRLPLSKRFEELSEVIIAAKQKLNLSKYLITQGKKGCTFVKNSKLFECPTLIDTTKDTVGAGDAAFALASLLVYAEVDNEIVPFLANCAGGIAANIMGNKESITKDKLLTFINEVYENGMGRI